MKTFREWYEKIGTNCLVLYFDENQRCYMAKIDRPGWFSGQWFEVPSEIVITENDVAMYGGL